MTESEAKEILRQRLEQIEDKENPLVWVSDLKEEMPDFFVFEAIRYCEGKDPQAEALVWHVVKADGYCVPNL